MAGRYDYGSLMADPKSFRTRTPSKQTTDEQGFLHFLGSIAPAAGSVIGGGIGALAGGGIPGAALGASIGGGVGQLAGGAANYGADSMTASDDAFNQKQQDRKAALMNALMAARR